MSSAKVKGWTDAYEAVARLLIRTLTVPQVFFEAEWPEPRKHVDIMAIDRAGAGDLHVVEVKGGVEQVKVTTLRQLIRIPAHYRWMAVRTAGESEAGVRALIVKLAEDGIGCIGIVVMANGDPGAVLLSKPKRAGSFDRAQLGTFLKRRVPDIEYGEGPRASATETATAPLPKEKIHRYLDEADRLVELGHERAAFLLAWSAAEAVMSRLLDAPNQAPLRPPGALIREMQEAGRLTASDVDLLRSAFRIRNMLAHGRDDPPDVSAAYQIIAGLARKLLDSDVNTAPIG
jgi:hypothetical protein